jgi:hypothetical protein
MTPCFNNLLSQLERNLTKNSAKKRSCVETDEGYFQAGAIPLKSTSTLLWQIFKEV